MMISYPYFSRRYPIPMTRAIPSIIMRSHIHFCGSLYQAKRGICSVSQSVNGAVRGEAIPMPSMIDMIASILIVHTCLFFHARKRIVSHRIMMPISKNPAIYQSDESISTRA
jgi:hypothetical protein